MLTGIKCIDVFDELTIDLFKFYFIMRINLIFNLFYNRMCQQIIKLTDEVLQFYEIRIFKGKHDPVIVSPFQS